MYLLWLALMAHCDGLWHLMRGHDLRWRDNVDEYCAGDITCYCCPDTSDGVSDLAIWCRGRR